MEPADTPDPRGRAAPSPALRRALAATAGLCVGLAATVAYLVIDRGREDPRELVEVAQGLEDVRAEALAQLVEGAEGVWDSFPDADVGRVMQPGVQGRNFRGVAVSSNAFGMREEPYEARKPAGTTRVVLLGDSFVYGYKAEAGDRLGVFLRGFLAERGVTGPVECLHLAASSWNVLAEASYLRRQLDTLRPDLVVHVVIANDLDDTQGPRGFGAMGGYSPQVRERADGLVSQLTPRDLWPKRLQTYLLYAVDHESRERYATAAREIARLARAVEASGGRYLLLANWESYLPMVPAYLAGDLREDQLAYVSQRFTADPRFRIDQGDRHWNRAGHERIAQLLYGLIQRRGLLPGHTLAPWDAADRAVDEVHVRGRQEASFRAEYEAELRRKAEAQIRSAIELASLERWTAKQVYAGLDAEGHVAPYAAFVLARAGGSELVLRGRRLGGGALAGGHARVSVEGLPVGRVALQADGEAIDERWPLPDECRTRAFLSVRIESDDYVYADLAAGTCAAFRLEELAIR